MQAVKRSTVVGLDKGRRAHIGIDHGFFDDLMCLQTRHLLHPGHVTLLNVDNTLTAIKIQSASLILGITKRGMNVGKGRNRPTDGVQIFLSTRQRRIVIQVSLHFFISQAAMGANQRIVEGVGADDALFRHLHVADQGQSKDVGLK